MTYAAQSAVFVIAATGDRTSRAIAADLRRSYGLSMGLPLVRGTKMKDSTTMSGSTWLWVIQVLVLRPENRSTVAISSGLIAFWNAWRADRTRSAAAPRTMARRRRYLLALEPGAAAGCAR